MFGNRSPWTQLTNSYFEKYSIGTGSRHAEHISCAQWVPDDREMILEETGAGPASATS